MRFIFFGSLRTRLALLVAVAIAPSMLMVVWMALDGYRNALHYVENATGNGRCIEKDRPDP